MEPFNQVNCLKYQSKYSYQGQLKSYLIQLSYMLMMDNRTVDGLGVGHVGKGNNKANPDDPGLNGQ